MTRTSRIALSAFLASAALSACEPGQLGATRHTHTGEYGTETSASGLTIRDDWSRSEGWVVSTPLRSDLPGTRVSALLTTLAPGSLPPFETRGLRGNRAVTGWIPLASTFEEGETHVALADFAVPVDAAQIRIRESDIEAIVDLRWSVVDPNAPAESETETRGVRTEALRADLRALGIIPREDWGAVVTDCTSEDGGRSRISIHHTEGPAADPARQLRSIQSYHRSKGWCDIGYHFLVDASGRIYEGRAIELLGAHVRGNNTGNLGISFIGCYDDAECSAPTPLQEEAIQQAGRLVGTLSAIYGITPSSSTVRGHRDQVSTTCPGSRLYARLGDIIAVGQTSTLGGAVVGGGAPPPSGGGAPAGGAGSTATCAHSYGGTYGDRACSESYQCCSGSWTLRSGGCGACTCVEGSGSVGCGVSGGGGGGGVVVPSGTFASLSQGGSELPRRGIRNTTLNETLGVAVEPYGNVTSDADGSWVVGTISHFGGPSDRGVSATETGSVTGERLRSLNDPESPSRATINARPEDFYYVAMRWDFTTNGRTFWRNARIAIRNPSTGVTVIVRPVDWGPNTSTGRIVDVSPQAMNDVGLSTDDNVMVSFAPAGTPLGPYTVSSPAPAPAPEPAPAPAPEPAPAPRAFPILCDYCEQIDGTLASGAEAIEPGGTYFLANSGVHQAWLHGPSGADYDLRLVQWDGSGWNEVASSAGNTNEEHIEYSGVAGYYAWVVRAYSGSGSYSLEISRP